MLIANKGEILKQAMVNKLITPIIMTDPTMAGGGLSWVSIAARLMGNDY